MLVTVKEFNVYSGDFEGEETTPQQGQEVQKSDVTLLKEQLLKSAQNIVSDFLRFDPAQRVWTEGKNPGEDCPDIILLTIKKIATLQLMESGENIGITGKSMPDNSRTFINLNDKGSYKSWLRPIQNYREVAF